MTQKYTLLIYQDEDDTYFGKVLELKGFLSQGNTLDELINNIKEAIELFLGVNAENSSNPEYTRFVGLHQVEII